MNRAGVMELLAKIPRGADGLFGGLDLVTVGGRKFILSVQGSSTHYSSPREELDNLGLYKDVEVAMYEPDSPEWMKPEEVGFTRVKGSWDGPIGYVPLGSLLADLEEFFGKGGSLG